jgi:hypothetical protein
MKSLCISLLALFHLTAFAQDHGHLNVGAYGEQLIFDNGAVFNTDTNYVKTLTFRNGFQYAGYYQGNITLTVLAATPAHLGPVSNCPALGSRIFAQLVSVDGPAGGAFAFWDTGAATPTISLACGTTGTNLFRLSENDGSPGTDPFGHIHGRRFTATKAGIYTVGFRAFDFSTNGPGGGPPQTPSTVFKIYFQAGDNFRSVASSTNGALVTFATRLGYSWQLQGSLTLSSPDWQDIGEPVTGNDYFQSVLDDSLTNSSRFYRISGSAIIP